MSALPRLLALCVLFAAAGCVTNTIGENAGSLDEAAQYNVQLGLEYMKQGRRELAFEKLRRALEQDPDYAGAHTAIAYAYSVYGEPDRAETHYRRAMNLDRDDAGIKNTYGTFLCERGRMEEAETMLVRAANAPDYGTPEVAWTNAGLCAERAGDIAKAERFYREALRVNERYPTALWQMAQVSFAASNALPARGFLQRYHAVAPRSPHSLWLGYRIEHALSDEAAASVYASRLRADFGDSPEARLLEDAERGRGR